MENPKKQYEAPALVVHGNVEEITRDLDTGNDDAPAGNGFHAAPPSA